MTKDFLRYLLGAFLKYRVCPGKNRGTIGVTDFI